MGGKRSSEIYEMYGRSMFCSCCVGQEGTCFASKKRNKVTIIIKIKEKIQLKIRKHDSGEKKSKKTMVKTTVTKKKRKNVRRTK